MNKLFLLAPLALLAACGSEKTAEPTGKTLFFNHPSGAQVSVKYTSGAESLMFKLNATSLIGAVVIDEMDDIGFSRGSQPVGNGNQSYPLACDVTIEFDEVLILENKVRCLKDSKTMESAGAVFHFIGVLNTPASTTSGK